MQSWTCPVLSPAVMTDPILFVSRRSWPENQIPLENDFPMRTGSSLTDGLAIVCDGMLKKDFAATLSWRIEAMLGFHGQSAAVRSRLDQGKSLAS